MFVVTSLQLLLILLLVNLVSLLVTSHFFLIFCDFISDQLNTVVDIVILWFFIFSYLMVVVSVRTATILCFPSLRIKFTFSLIPFITLIKPFMLSLRVCFVLKRHPQPLLLELLYHFLFAINMSIAVFVLKTVESRSCLTPFESVRLGYILILSFMAAGGYTFDDAVNL